ncbi:fluoride efflux transporter CrcB [Listeria cossartiae subsp. cayugensis]|uniref:Fluoride-specific ion channel FluC n=1 Tax=Listeria cossartiae subsp. cayugensis TaxID=2713505 RepID=A0ABU2INK3_9LIST|nr:MULTISPECIES: fluoride efflux transporter CrcB [Listeria]MDT0003588.1 fluoride efflux transporter CrcB [Listeria cossartiae subsp. cayugensis]MDT0014534.1 fluoride efflux transporter CrcB [Listeria cossartiae subsp. cayugensis]MDT0019982.1 fluoride efflux transporter CrcB [Listeria cossartiae subsp. cayugensis]MDT0036862.1 fluoride efflux transporter CrcB [Listeria cossartiae subsp. cayugensis]MDT0041733.1 fluoride efflux transporter CrcB [Listeria cossartiae subsp. cayugensis]
MYFLYVGVFGALGGMCRYAMNLWFGGEGFPYATLAVNLIGCFLLAFLMQFLAEKSRISLVILNGIGTGFIGAFTTFSAFSVDTIQLLQNGDVILAISYVLVSLIGGLVMVKLGRLFSDRLLKRGARHVH